MHSNRQTPNVVDADVRGALTRTFVVRVWEPIESPREPAAELRGVVEHVQTGTAAIFESADALLVFLRTPTGGRKEQPGGGP